VYTTIPNGNSNSGNTDEVDADNTRVEDTQQTEAGTDVDLPIALRKGKRKCTYPIASYVTHDKIPQDVHVFISTVDSITLPKTIGEAISSPKWCEAMIEEMKALEQNNTWDLVTLPPNKKAIGCKWVFSVKMNADGSVSRLKARLVAKGYAQTYGIDYAETFSPVAKMTSIRLFISLAARFNWKLHQLDIKNAFLHGDLAEEVYMEQPPGFVAQGETNRVCRLKKSLYGLKQSPRAWFGKLSLAIEKYGICFLSNHEENHSKSDHSVFYKHSEHGLILLVVYVDDIVITGNDESGIYNLKKFIHSQFQTKDLGELKYFLGVEITRSSKGIYLSQRKYTLDLLKETGKLAAKPCTTPMIPNQSFTKEGELMSDPERYRRLVGKLNYLCVTRPDIAYSVSVMSQFMSCPTIQHWVALEQILCYLKGTVGKGVVYMNHGHLDIESFSDADWAGSKTDRRSTSGFCVFLGGNLIAWKSKKQSVVSRSSAESEYRAMANATCEIMWLRHLMEELKLKQGKPAKLWFFNTFYQLELYCVKHSTHCV